MAVTRDKQIVKHDALIAQYKICTGVINACDDKIIEAVNEEWLEEISYEVLGFKTKTVQEMLKPLKD